jgi:hypothetical protein
MSHLKFCFDEYIVLQGLFSCGIFFNGVFTKILQIIAPLNVCEKHCFCLAYKNYKNHFIEVTLGGKFNS